MRRVGIPAGRGTRASGSGPGADCLGVGTFPLASGRRNGLRRLCRHLRPVRGVFPAFSLRPSTVGRALAPPLKRLFGPAAYLAGRSVARSRTRVAVSVGSLLTAVALFAGLTIMVHSFRNTVSAWVHQTVSGDLFVTPRLNEINRHRNIFRPVRWR